jgi:sec-independent protein translocase protein TatA|tara:strand:- start:12958 stop:13269 length:312 start_codon:yes stop_codon:yes gene_type:complete
MWRYAWLFFSSFVPLFQRELLYIFREFLKERGMSPSWIQLLIVVVVALLLFGGRGRISSIMGDMAKGIGAFRKGLKDEEETKSVDNDDMVNVTPKKDETKASS